MNNPAPTDAGAPALGPDELDELDTLLDMAFAALPLLVDIQKRAIAIPLGSEPVTVQL